MCGEKDNVNLPIVHKNGSPPRVRGEAGKADIRTRRGSPPRVRGEENSRGSRGSRVRITPACAGRSKRIAPKKPSEKDHPCVCGEKRYRRLSRRINRGSPPRVRGEVSLRAPRSLYTRITPACAGRSESARRTGPPNGDHPRVCGEKNYLRATTCSAVGSPPRVRGEVAVLARAPPLVGITPACAGRRR